MAPLASPQRLQLGGRAPWERRDCRDVHDLKCMLSMHVHLSHSPTVQSSCRHIVMLAISMLLCKLFCTAQAHTQTYLCLAMHEQNMHQRPTSAEPCHPSSNSTAPEHIKSSTERRADAARQDLPKMALTTSRRMQGMEVGCIGESNTAWPRFGASFCPCGNSRTPNVEA